MIDRGNGCAGERISAREIFPIPKDRPQRLWHYPARRLTSDEVPVDPEAFELTVQPFGPANVSVRVGEECAVLKLDRSGHGFPQSPWQSVACTTTRAGTQGDGVGIM